MIIGMFFVVVGFDYYCFGDEKFKVVVIVNWFGIIDVKDLLEGINV